MRISRRKVGGAAAAAFAALAVGGAAAHASPAAPAAPLSQTELDAMVQPSIVYIYGTYEGHVHYGGQHYSDSVTSAYYCTGFVVGNSEGEATIMTAGHCADKNEAKGPLIEQFLAERYKDGYITAKEAKELYSYGMTYWTIVGDAAGTKVNQTIYVYEPSAASGMSTSTRMEASVMSDRPFSQGDMALLQVHTDNPLPAIKVAAGEPQAGDALTAVGYPSAVANVTDASLTPSFETGHMNSLQTRDGYPVIQFDAGLSPGMSGGPVVNDQGEVIGVNSYRNSQETQQFNFAVDLSSVHSFLTSHGVSNTLSPADAAYRQGLQEYYAGQYREAIQQFGTTLNVIPNDALAQQYKSQATTKAASEPKPQPVTKNKVPTKAKPVAKPASKPESAPSSSSGLSVGLIAAIAVAAIVLLGGGGFAFSRRKRPQPALAGGFAGGAGPVGPVPVNTAPLNTAPVNAPVQPSPAAAPWQAPTPVPPAQQDLHAPAGPFGSPVAPAPSWTAPAEPAAPVAPPAFAAPAPAPEPAAAPSRHAAEEPAGVFCPQCGAHYDAGVQFCSHDGTRLS